MIIILILLQKDNGPRKSSHIPILGHNGRQNGYNTYQAEGKSKFYNGDVESDDIEEMPEEDREGQSRFYRQEAVDSKTPDKEGFSEIFNGK